MSGDAALPGAAGADISERDGNGLESPVWEYQEAGVRPRRDELSLVGRSAFAPQE